MGWWAYLEDQKMRTDVKVAETTVNRNIHTSVGNNEQVTQRVLHKIVSE